MQKESGSAASTTATAAASANRLYLGKP